MGGNEITTIVGNDGVLLSVPLTGQGFCLPHKEILPRLAILLVR
jgi:hypothetical protein